MTVDLRATMADLADGADVPVWIRIGCIALALADETGHARLATGQLRTALGLSKQQTSDALAVARARGWIDPCSTARCIVIPKCGAGRCEEWHR